MERLVTSSYKQYHLECAHARDCKQLYVALFRFFRNVLRKQTTCKHDLVASKFSALLKISDAY